MRTLAWDLPAHATDLKKLIVVWQFSCLYIGCQVLPSSWRALLETASFELHSLSARPSLAPIEADVVMIRVFVVFCVSLEMLSVALRSSSRKVRDIKILFGRPDLVKAFLAVCRSNQIVGIVKDHRFLNSLGSFQF